MQIIFIYSWEPALGLVTGFGEVQKKHCQNIFTYKHSHWLFNLKTKVVQHVPRIDISILHMASDIWQHDKQLLLSLDMHYENQKCPKDQPHQINDKQSQTLLFPSCCPKHLALLTKYENSIQLKRATWIYIIHSYTRLATFGDSVQ